MLDFEAKDGYDEFIKELRREEMCEHANARDEEGALRSTEEMTQDEIEDEWEARLRERDESNERRQANMLKRAQLETQVAQATGFKEATDPSLDFQDQVSNDFNQAEALRKAAVLKAQIEELERQEKQTLELNGGIKFNKLDESPYMKNQGIQALKLRFDEKSGQLKDVTNEKVFDLFIPGFGYAGKATAEDELGAVKQALMPAVVDYLEKGWDDTQNYYELAKTSCLVYTEEKGRRDNVPLTAYKISIIISKA